MVIQAICQWVVLCLLSAGFFANVYHIMHGREEQEPGGFGHFVLAFLLSGLAAVVFYGAGAFSTIFGNQ